MNFTITTTLRRPRRAFLLHSARDASLPEAYKNNVASEVVRTRPSPRLPLALSPPLAHPPRRAGSRELARRSCRRLLPHVVANAPESVAAQAQAQGAAAAAAAAAGQCKMAAALAAAVDGAAGPGTVGAAASRRMTRNGKRAAEPRRLTCL